MAVGQISTTNGTGSSTAGVAATATITASVGDTLIVVAGSDDRASADAMSATAVTDSAGNTWTRLLSQQNTNATANDFCALAIFGTIVTNALSSGTVTLTPTATVPVKDFTLYRFTGLSLTIRGSNIGTGTGATPPAIAISSPLDGDLVIAATVLEGPTSDTWTADSDTTNGSWSTDAVDGTTGGTATSQISIHSQYKIVNASGTQTYDGSNSVSRDWCRGIIALAPTPPPAAAALPPAYVQKAGARFSMGNSRFTSGQDDCYAIGPNFDSRLPPLIMCPGVYNPAASMTGFDLAGIEPIIHALVDEGFAVLAGTSLGSFGNTAGQTAITDAITYGRNTLGCSNLPVPIIGFSEGGCDAMTWAYTNPTLVACVVGVIPIIDLAEFCEQDVFGLSAAVYSAWSVGGLPLPAGADPNTAGHRTTLSSVPMQHWYSTNDEVSANITAFRDATNCDIRALGELGHTSAAVAAAWPTDIVRFMRKHIPVPRKSGR